MTSLSTKYYSISDSRWSEAKIEPYSFVDDAETAEPVESYPDQHGSGLLCTVCKASVGDDRSDLVTHYKSDWHRHNLRRILQSRPLITEDEFEQKIFDEDEISSFDSESDEEIMPFFGGAHAYFLYEGNVYSTYRCILRRDELISADLFRRPLDCAVLLLSGGHFCGGVFENDSLVVHKTFHRYVIRAKQGTLQSVSDARGNAPKSLGASLRRHNEKALKEEIQSLLGSWAESLDHSPLIFLRCPTLQRHIFFEKNKYFKLEKSDERLRTIPFETRRPTLEELQRTWSRLKVVRSHGSVNVFNEELQRRAKLRTKQRRLFRRKISEGAKHPPSESSSDSESDNEKNIAKEPEVTAKQTELMDSEQCDATVNNQKLDDAVTQAVYTAVRLNSVSNLHQLLDANGEKREDLLRYIRETKFPPAASTFLHITARRGTVEILEELLLLGCDPSVKDSDGKLPFQVAQNRTVRQAFSKFRSEHPDAFNWNFSQIPVLAVLSEEQLAKEAEKKRIQREKKKQRDKAKRAAQYEERMEKERRLKYLALSDREKRALAAERRIAASLQTRCQIVENDGNRCFKCGAVLSAKPFEYCDNRFCSLICLQQHRQENASQLIS